jgi:hypothetical protein
LRTGLLEGAEHRASAFPLDLGLFEVRSFVVLRSPIDVSLGRCLLPTIDQKTGVKDDGQEPWKTLRT